MAEINNINEIKQIININNIEELTASRTAIIEISKMTDPYMAVLSSCHEAGIDVEFRDYMESHMVKFLDSHHKIRDDLKNQNIDKIGKNIWGYLNTERINNVIKKLHDIRNDVIKYFDENKLDINEEEDCSVVFLDIISDINFNKHIFRPTNPYPRVFNVVHLLNELICAFRFNKSTTLNIFYTDKNHIDVEFHSIWERCVISDQWNPYIREFIVKNDVATIRLI